MLIVHEKRGTFLPPHHPLKSYGNLEKFLRMMNRAKAKKKNNKES